MNVLVTGGTGFLGSNLARSLLQRSDRVRVLGRNQHACDALAAAGAEIARIDLRDGPGVMDACVGMDVVCHAGAFSAPWGRQSDFLSINVGGTANVIAGCKAHGVSRLVYISSPSVVFSGRDGAHMTESAPYPRRFASVYSETKAMGERLVTRAFGEGLSTVTLRPKAIFGPGDTSLLPRILSAAAAGRLPQIGSGANRVDLTYVDNVVDAILLAFLSDNASGHTYTITNGEPVLLWNLIREILGRLDYPSQLRTLPFPVVYGAAALMEGWAALTGREPLLTCYIVAILGRTQTYDITAARRDLGYSPKVSLSEGVDRTLGELKRNNG
ncbi:MAG: NAD-dependent epimerase/dehydratase family protein [Armatimonadota bacterium]|nr:NAD-dependent epimerase/dehydratase family protein [Armatimonadota bacterium]